MRKCQMWLGAITFNKYSCYNEIKGLLTSQNMVLHVSIFSIQLLSFESTAVTLVVLGQRFFFHHFGSVLASVTTRLSRP